MKLVDRTGQRYGRLTVIERGKDLVVNTDGRHYVRWRCQCDCGNVVEVTAANLKNGSTRSCGCIRKETCRQTGIRIQKEWRAFSEARRKEGLRAGEELR